MINMKILILLVLCLTTIDNVFTLECYATDLDALQTGDMTSKVQDCKDNIKKAFEMQGQTTPIIPKDITFSCYQVNVISDAVSLAIKGCIPEGGCDIMKATFRALFDKDPTTPVKSVNCYECQYNKCNSRSPNSANIKHSVGFFITILVALTVLV